MISHRGKIVSSYGSKKYTPKKIRLRSLDFSINKWYQHLPSTAKPAGFNILQRFIFYVPPKPYSYYITKVYDDGTIFSIGTLNDFFMTFDHNFDDSVSLDTLLPVSKMSDFSLFNHYKSFDFDIHNPARYALVNNEMIDRGLLKDKYLSPNDFSMSFYDD